MLARRLRYWLESSRRSEALREEMELHLAERAAELEAGGMSPVLAQAEARRRFGNIGLKQEESREVWITRFWSELAQDIRYGLRTMAANKAFSTLAVLSLALGIGANTAIFSLMESILLRSLPVANPESLVVLNWHSRPPLNANKEWVHVVHGVQGVLWPGDRGALVSGMFPYAAYEQLRHEKTVFSTLFGYFDAQKRTLRVRGQATSIGAEYVTGEYFRGLAVSPAAGRLIEPEDDQQGASSVAVISFATSQTHFGGAANAINQSIFVDNTPFTVIGVAPPEFFGVDPAASPDVYLPLQTHRLVDGAESARMYADGNFYWIEMMGRLRPGVTMAQAQAALAPLFNQWISTTATTDGERANLPALVLNPGSAGLGSLRRQYSKPLYVLLAMVALILAITCANIANLLLARAAARGREMAVRLSLGAGRFRVVRQLLTESVMLAFLGGALGIVFAIWGVQSLTLLFSRGQENFTLRAELNGTVLAMTAALSLLCGLLFGIAPALQATRRDLASGLRKGPFGRTHGLAPHVLIVIQIAMSFVILLAAGLFVRTLDNLREVELGYARENILLFSLDARQAGYREPEITTFYADLRRRIESIPGVNSATFSHSSIIRSGQAGRTYRGAVKIGTATVQGARVMLVGPHFLTTMQIPMPAGREIDDRDQPGSRPVAVISEQVARTYFGSENPLGRRLTFEGEKRELEIVGVSGNVRSGGLKNEGSPMTVFAPIVQFSPDHVTFALRTSGDPLAYVQSVHGLVRQADPRIPVTNIVTQASDIDRTISREIVFAQLCTAFALLALLMACLGLYGTVSYNVARRTGEFGVRIALGAQRGAVVWMVLRHVLWLVAAGLAVSVPVALLGARLLQSLLFGIKPNDPGTLALSGLVLLCAAIAAGYVPARRATRIDPLAALRQE
jgi:macrolide transport system ATP-binding/permease protein